MNNEVVMKFKKLFEEEKTKLQYANASIIQKDFEIQSDEMSDEVDLTSVVMEQGMKMRLRSREALFLKKIDEALDRISAGTFGHCEECDEAIELKRLEARPTATLCIDCKEQQEHHESMSADGRRHKSLGDTRLLNAKLQIA